MQRTKKNKYEYPQWDNKFSTAMKIIWVHVKKLFTDRIVLKIISVFFAILLWGYIATESNPEVDKTFKNIPVSTQSVSVLHAKDLAVADDLTSLFEKGVTVEVGAKIKNYNTAVSSDLDVALDLTGVNAAGVQRVPVVVRSNNANMTVKNYSPKYVDLKIDAMDSRVMHVGVEFTGDLPDHIWRGESELLADTVTVSGPTSVVESIARAKITIDQSQLKTSLNGDTLPISLIDGEGKAVSKNVVQMSNLVAMNMEVLHKKTVTFDFARSLINGDKLKEGYELAGSTYAYPSENNEIVLLGSEKALNEFGDQVQAEPIDLNGRDASITSVERKLVLPEGIRALHGENILISVNITEKTVTKILEMPLKTEKPSNWKLAIHSMGVANVKIHVTGPALKVDGLNNDSIKATVDLRGLKEGNHTLPIRVTGVPEGVEYTLDPTSVTVVLKKK